MNEEPITDPDSIIELLQDFEKGLRGEFFEEVAGEEYLLALLAYFLP